MNEEIEKIFENFIVDGVKIPIGFIKYFGKEETYLTYQSAGNDPSMASDDQIKYSEDTIDIDIYTKGNYLNIMKEIKNKMLANDYVWDGDSPDMYEQDTGYYHKTTSFVKERVV